MPIIPVFKRPARAVTRVFIHCSASDNPAHDDVSVIRQWHLQRGFKDVGYHYYIKKNGNVQAGRSLEIAPAAQQGHNSRSIAICLGGLDEKQFTTEQFQSLSALCNQINNTIPKVTFHGHREVEPNKTCPVFNYKRILMLDDKGRIKPQL